MAARTYRLDLHTHSLYSADGSINERDYRAMLDCGGLDYIAVTDHDTIEFATRLRAELGDRIIIGEEITTRQGELIGLFLHKSVAAGLDMLEAATRIHRQGGLVYVPHPFEAVRHGLKRTDLDALASQVDIVEAYNGRALFQNKSVSAKAWAATHGVAMAASSDAHGIRGWGRTYTVIKVPPTARNLVACLRPATLVERTVGFRGVLYPKLNRLRKRVH